MNVGIRWQQEMEDAISTYKERVHVIRQMEEVRIPDRGDNYEQAIARHASIANAAATTALALAVANAGSDIEVAISKLHGTIEDRI